MGSLQRNVTVITVTKVVAPVKVSYFYFIFNDAVEGKLEGRNKKLDYCTGSVAWAARYRVNFNRVN